MLGICNFSNLSYPYISLQAAKYVHHKIFSLIAPPPPIFDTLFSLQIFDGTLEISADDGGLSRVHAIPSKL